MMERTPMPDILRGKGTLLCYVQMAELERWRLKVIRFPDKDVHADVGLVVEGIKKKLNNSVPER